MLTSSPTFSSYSYHSPSVRSIFEKGVFDSIPVADQSPFYRVRMIFVRTSNRKENSEGNVEGCMQKSYICFELCKLKPTAIKFENLLLRGWRLLQIDHRWCFYRGRVFSLRIHFCIRNVKKRQEDVMPLCFSA